MISGRIRKIAYGIIPYSTIIRKIYNKRRSDSYLAKYLSDADAAEVEQDSEKKRELIQKAREKKPWVVNENQNELKSKLGENVDPAVLEDALFCRLVYGFTADEYLSYHLEGRTVEYRRSFLSEYQCKALCCKMNDRYDCQLFRDKPKTYEIFKDYYHRDALMIESDDDYSAFLRFIDGKREFIKKLPSSSLGKGIELFQLSSYTGRERQLFEELRSQGNVFLEEKVEQSKLMAAFHPASVNTVRFIVFNTKEGVQVPFCFFKTGRNGAVIDNGGAGGILIGVNARTGITDTDGFDENGNQYSTHPNSGYTFRGFQLPEYDSAISMCRELMQKTPRIKYVGWDLAHTDHGWLVIEGNSLSQMIGPQLTSQRGMRKEFEDMVRKTGIKI